MTYFDFIPRVAGYKKGGEWIIPNRYRHGPLPKDSGGSCAEVDQKNITDLRDEGDLPRQNYKLDD